MAIKGNGITASRRQMNDNERDGDDDKLALDEQAFRQVIMNGGGGCDKCSGFGPGGIKKRRQDEYLSDPSIEDSIRLCGNQHGRG